MTTDLRDIEQIPFLEDNDNDSSEPMGSQTAQTAQKSKPGAGLGVRKTRRKPDKRDIAGQAKATPQTICPTGQGEPAPTQSPTQSGDPVERLLQALASGEKSSGELRQILGVKHRPTFRDNYLHPALQQGFIEMTCPDKPNSRLQKYRLTAKSRKTKKRGQ